jgi:lysophospholipase L1-like esterase
MNNRFYVKYLFVLALAVSFASTGFSQTDTIRIDFGNNFSPLPWNNVSDPNSGEVANLIDQKENETGIAVMVVDSFNNINTAGTQTPDPALGLPGTATSDSFFGNVTPFGGQEQPTGAVELHNLDTSRVYTFSIFASRAATDNREAQYVIAGQGIDTVYLDAASNTDMVAVGMMKPDASGVIRVTASPGPNNTNGSGFYYLGSMELYYDEVPVLTVRDTVSIDFGDNLSLPPWNNIANPNDAEATMLLNQRGDETAFGLTVVDSFNNINRTGSMSPDPSLGIPASATGDSFFGNVTPFGGQVQPTGAVQLNNLTPGETYSLTIFASRNNVNDVREAQYVVTGAGTDTVFLDASNNADMVVRVDMVADTAGLITIEASPGPNNTNGSAFYYLGAIQCAYDALPPVLPSDTVLIDFGDNLSVGGWNNVSSPDTGMIADLVDDNGVLTGYGIAVVDSFNNINRSGSSNPDPALGFPPTATGDSFFGNVTPFGGQTQPTGAVELFNLNTNFVYTFSIYAARNGVNDVREAQYAIAGRGLDTVYLDASNNDSTLVVAQMVPDTSGVIRITASPGPNNTNGSGFYYLGLMKMTWERQPPEFVKDTILVDFGPNASPLPWNNIADPNAGSIADLLRTNNLTSGVSIEIYDDFNNANTAGTLAPDPALGIPPSASGDSFFGNIAEFGGQQQPTAGLIMRNFDPTEPVEISFFASRTASDVRETRYLVTGATADTVFLNVSSNTDNLAVASVLPAADGTIDIQVSAGPRNNNSFSFYYLGAMKVVYESTAEVEASLDLVSPNGGEFWQVGKTPSIQWSSKNVQDLLLEYSVDNGTNWDTIGTFPGVNQEYLWTVPDQPTTEALVRISGDTLTDVSEMPFTISSDTSTCTIVVLGSSTAEGVGATPDSSWVERYRNELTQGNTTFEVINLARGGYTTYHILPDGTEIPSGTGVSIDSERNVTEALTYNPSAIIINMPSNDATRGFGADRQLDNFAAMYNAGQAAGSRVYITTTQPRNFTSQSQIDIQTEVRDSILSIYGDQAIDFWTGAATPDGMINPDFDSGDGIHQNNDGHSLMFQRVLGKMIDTVPCSPITDIYDVDTYELDAVRLYPNPFDDQVQGIIQVDAAGELEITVFNNLGQPIQRQRLPLAGPGEYTFQLEGMSQLAPAVYWIRTTWSSQGKTGIKTLPLIKR